MRAKKTKYQQHRNLAGGISHSMKRLFGVLTVYVCTLVPLTLSQSSTITRLCGSVDAPANLYVDELVELALSYTSQQFNIEKHGLACSHPREVAMLEQGKTDFFWAGTSQDLENRLIPIRIPIYKGMLGYRIMLIRGGEQHRFNRVNTLDDLLKYTVGQGETWADTPILKHSGFQVTTSTDPKNLAYMMNSKRFDAYPRGMMEPWVELIAWADIDLEVEQNLVLVYPMPAYIFVSPKKPKLAELIETGLKKAIRDGKFDEHFFADSRVSTGLAKAKLQNRIRIPLVNPNLPQNTPLEEAELWLHPEDFTR